MSAESVEPHKDARICAQLAHCPICGEPNRCRLETGEAYKGSCWCERPTLSSAALHRLLEDLPEPRCLCQRCLEAIAANEEITWEELVAGSRPTLPPPSTDGNSYLEDGGVVFTAQFHLRRGYCCGSGCRHCPYAD